MNHTSIRPPTTDDAEDLAHLLRDDHILRRELGMDAENLPAAAAVLDEIDRWCARRNAVTYAIRAGGRAIGTISISHRDERRGRACVGCWIGSRERRRGHGGRALRLTLEEARHQGFLRIRAKVENSNLGSRRICEKAGAAASPPEGNRTDYELEL